MNAEYIENQDPAAAILSFVYKLPFPIKKHSKYLSGSHLASLTHQVRCLSRCWRQDSGTNHFCYGNRRAPSPRRHAMRGACDRAGPAREAHALGLPDQGRATRPRVRTEPAALRRTCRGRSFSGGARRGGRRRRRSGRLRGDCLNWPLFLGWYQNGTGTRKSRRIRGRCGNTTVNGAGPAGTRAVRLRRQKRGS